MKLSQLKDLNVENKKVILRADLDVDVEDTENKRLKTLLPTVKYLIDKRSKIIMIGHRGRPSDAEAMEGKSVGKVDGKYSLAPVVELLKKLLDMDIAHIHDLVGQEAEDRIGSLESGQIAVLMNLRFDAREEENDEEFAKRLASFGEAYVNEAFGNSHRKHASMVGVPKFLPSAAGFHFADEVENLGRVLKEPKKPVVLVLGGAKEDKLSYLDPFRKIADKILVGGKLPLFLGEDFKDDKVIVANLNQDKEDITLHSVEAFEREITKAGTVIFAGPMGKYEEEGQRLGTKRVLDAISKSSAFKVAGGGDTEEALLMFECEEKFDWVSTGGGAALEYLASGTLPAIEALKK